MIENFRDMFPWITGEWARFTEWIATRPDEAAWLALGAVGVLALVGLFMLITAEPIDWEGELDRAWREREEGEDE